MDPKDNSNQENRKLDSKMKEKDSKMKLKDLNIENNEVSAQSAFDKNRN
jgi:hypothetical protein